MIPVVMGEDNEQILDRGLVCGLLQYLVAKRNDAGARIAKHNVIVDTDLHARGVATDSQVRVERRAVGSTHAPETEIGLAHI